jgi:hypothetical protein
MKKTLLTGIAALSVLYASAAMSAEVPKQYLGQWCGGDNRVAYRCQKPTAADIGKDRVDNIPLERVTRTAKGHRLHITVDTEPERLELWFDTRRRLHMRWLDYGEK